MIMYYSCSLKLKGLEMQPSEDDELIEKGSWMSSQAEDEWYRTHPDQEPKRRYIGKDKAFVQRNFEPINRRELKTDYLPSDEDLEKER